LKPAENSHQCRELRSGVCNGRSALSGRRVEQAVTCTLRW
jgi:hypothetical protein